MQKWHDDVAYLQGRTWHISTNVLIRPDKPDGRERRLVHIGTVHTIELAGGYAVGVALLADEDAYVRKIGHTIARGRALKAAAAKTCLATIRVRTQWNYGAVMSAWLDAATFAARTEELRKLIKEQAEPAVLWVALQDVCRP